MSCTAFTANWIRSINNGYKAIIVSNVFSIPPSLYFSRLTPSQEKIINPLIDTEANIPLISTRPIKLRLSLSQAEAVNTEPSFYVDQRYIV